MRRFILISAAVILASCGVAREQVKPAPAESTKTISSDSAPTAQQVEDFGTLAKFVGKSFKGSPTAESEQQFTDIQTWEWALGGKAILIRHALEGGSYGGDTYVYKDAKTGTLTYVYVTNAGFHTVGEMTPTDTGWVAEEVVEGHETITRVRSTSVVHEDGSTSMTSDYLKDGAWVPGQAFEYAFTDEPLPELKTGK